MTLVNSSAHFDAVAWLAHARRDIASMNHSTREDEQIASLKFRGPKHPAAVLPPDICIPAEARLPRDDRFVGAHDDGQARRIYAAGNERQPHREAELYRGMLRVADQREVFVLVERDTLLDVRVANPARQDPAQEKIARALEAVFPAKDILLHRLQVTGIGEAFEPVRADRRRWNVPLMEQIVAGAAPVVFAIGSGSARGECFYFTRIDRAANDERFVCVQALSKRLEAVRSSKDWTHKRGAPVISARSPMLAGKPPIRGMYGTVHGLNANTFLLSEIVLLHRRAHESRPLGLH